MTAPVAGVVGLGLIGGSVARDLAALGWQVAAADRRPETLRAAERAGVARPFPLDEGPSADVELVVVAVPVDAVPAVLRRVGDWAPPAAVVTDVSSTKRSVVEAAGAAGLESRFVGSHPMTGDHRSGWGASRTGLFRGARVWLCPAPEAGDAAVHRVASLWRDLGADPAAIDATAHDRRVAWASHLPQVTASALAAVLDGAAISGRDLGPGGRDATRLAGSDPALWRDILMDNSDEVEPAVGALIDELTVLRRALQQGDDATIRALLASARDWAHTPSICGGDALERP